MAKKAMLIVGIILLGLSAGCAKLPFDVEEAYPYYPCKELDIYYNYAYEVGTYHDELYSLMGYKHPNNEMVLLIYDILPGEELTGIELVLINKAAKPVTIAPEQFILVSPQNQQFTYDVELQNKMANVNKDKKALYGSKIFQPDQAETVRIYFRVGDKNITQVGWRLGYSVPGSGFLGSTKTYYVWSHVAYKVEGSYRY